MPLIVHTNKKRVIRLGNYEKVQMAHIKTVSYFILKTFCDANESDATENEHVHRIHSAFFGVRVRWMPFFISSDFFRIHRDLCVLHSFLSSFDSYAFGLNGDCAAISGVDAALIIRCHSAPFFADSVYLLQ